MKKVVWFVLGMIVALGLVWLKSNVHTVTTVTYGNGERVVLAIDGEKVANELDEVPFYIADFNHREGE